MYFMYAQGILHHTTAFLCKFAGVVWVVCKCPLTYCFPLAFNGYPNLIMTKWTKKAKKYKHHTLLKWHNCRYEKRQSIMNVPSALIVALVHLFMDRNTVGRQPTLQSVQPRVAAESVERNSTGFMWFRSGLIAHWHLVWRSALPLSF